MSEARDKRNLGSKLFSEFGVKGRKRTRRRMNW